MVNKHLAIAANGNEPKIDIYAYPGMDIVKILPNNGSKPLRFLSFSPSGDLLAAQSVAPEYEVTVWQWKEAAIHIHLKSTFCDHTNAMRFSATNDQVFYTGGVKHIHVWNIVRTFTGLKLLHSHGSFGAYEDCDVLCVYSEQNGRVLTNCDWGNILVWQEGSIRYEISGKNRRPCHQKPITQVHLKGDYLYTIAMDNFVRIWLWDPLAFSMLHEDERFIELEVTYEFRIPLDARPIDIECLEFVIGEQNGQVFYVHDGRGVLWRCFVDAEYTTHEIDIMFRSSSMNVIAAGASSCYTTIATLDTKGVFCIYGIQSGVILCQHRFPTVATTMSWLPKHVRSCDTSQKNILVLPGKLLSFSDRACGGNNDFGLRKWISSSILH